MNKVIRAFIAIDIGRELRQELKIIQDGLKQHLRGKLTWVKPENIHLTLKFLGNITVTHLNYIGNTLDGIAREEKPFSVSLAQINAFPDITTPRIIWVGIDNAIAIIQDIQDKLEIRLSRAGFKKEAKEFYPHLTLARVKSIENRNEISKIFSQIKPKNLSADIDRIILFKSELTPQGAIYEKLYEKKLTG
ncbi:MAG: RNA 2',3'-cyclic phosphodiesterase [Candidatus Omnitrophica bacterium]|nr:RNA 2',3'-cyclic phosphodiesterase [Candidatus Omnitrophota bacterium]